MSKMDSCAIDSTLFTFYLEHCRIRKTKRQKKLSTREIY
jgi:hypothetical protein